VVGVVYRRSAVERGTDEPLDIMPLAPAGEGRFAKAAKFKKNGFLCPQLKTSVYCPKNDTFFTHNGTARDLAFGLGL